MMKRNIITSGDGTPTIYVEGLKEHYHSVFGARTESEHIYIGAGLNYFEKPEGLSLNVLEIGLGTGLNAYLTLLNKKEGWSIRYYGIEKYPLEKAEWEVLDYRLPEDDLPKTFEQIHTAEWEMPAELIPGFVFFKSHVDLNDFIPPSNQDIIYFDAFAPDVQPDLWSVKNFSKLYTCLRPGGILVTYSVKAMVKQNLKEAGFMISRLPGPRGKRHILRAVK